MEKKIILTNNAPAPIGPYSQAVFFNGILYASGQIAINPETGDLVTDTIENETHQVMHNVKAILNAAELDFSNIIKTSIFLTDMGQFGKVNEIYGSYFTDNPPARETIQVAALPKGVNVEISVIAGK
jgi:2-iminobutanoate/2-iminopropanoate deaminase